MRRSEHGKWHLRLSAISSCFPTMRVLLGLCFIFHEVIEIEGTLYRCPSSGKSNGRNCNSSKRNDTYSLPVQIHSAQLKLVVQQGERILLPCRIWNPASTIGWDSSNSTIQFAYFDPCALSQDRSESAVIWHHERHGIISGTEIFISTSTTRSVPERFRLMSDFTLQIFPLTTQDDGFYECIVHSWPPVSITHHVQVLEPPSVTLIPDSGSIIILEGEAVQLGCRPKGNPLPHVQWRKRGSSIPNHRSVVKDTSLTIYGTTPSDTGLYICEAENGVGRPALGRIHLRIHYVPRVKIPQKIISSGVGYKAKLLCSVVGDPLPEVNWFFKKKVVPTSKRVYQESSSVEKALHFLDVRESDFGVYMCLGNNTLGFGIGYVELSGVPSRPVVTQWETSSCDKNNNQKIRNKKKKKGRRFWRGRRQKTRNVTCIVHVNLNWAVESYSTLIDYRLMFRHVKKNLNSNSNVKFFNEDKIISWTQLSIPPDRRDTDDPIHQKNYVLHNIKSERKYEAALTARNKYGQSQLSAIFYFSTLPRTSHKVGDIDELFPNIPRGRALEMGGLEDKEDGPHEIYSREDSLTPSISSAVTMSTINNYLTTLSFKPTIYTKFIFIITHLFINIHLGGGCWLKSF